MQIQVRRTKRESNEQSLYTMAHLVHASLIESHYRGMGQPVKYSPQCLFGVKLLRLEKFFKEFFVEHGSDDVIHNYSQQTEKPNLSEGRKMHFPHSMFRSREISILYYMCWWKPSHSKPNPTAITKQQHGKTTTNVLNNKSKGGCFLCQIRQSLLQLEM